jgi:hypothetical protein
MSQSMKRFRMSAILLCALPLCAQDAGSFFSWPTDVINNELPSWLRFSGEERMRMEGYQNGGFKSNNADYYLLQRLRLNMKIQPAWWLKIIAQSQDAREFYKGGTPAPPYQDTWDLRLAYAEIGDMEKGFFALRVGRQDINLGEERLVGSSNWTNGARSFDAARLNLHHKKLRLDIFAASVVVERDGGLGEITPGSNIYGLYGGLDNVIPNSTIEPYLFWRSQSDVKAQLGGVGTYDMKIPGIRWVGTLPLNFDYNTDLALERGSVLKDNIDAWAGHWVVGYNMPAVRFTPRVFAEFNYATGSASAKLGERHTFDQLYATAHDKYGFSDQVGWKNIQQIRVGPEFKLTSRWYLSTRYSDYWLANAHDALYNTSNAVVAQMANGSAGRWVGQELDLVNAIKVSKITTIGGGLSHIFPGTFLKMATPGHAYTAPYLFFETKF